MCTKIGTLFRHKERGLRVHHNGAAAAKHKKTLIYKTCYICGSPTDTPGPKPNTTTGEPFIWFVVGLIFGLVAIGLVVVIYN